MVNFEEQFGQGEFGGKQGGQLSAKQAFSGAVNFTWPCAIKKKKVLLI